METAVESWEHAVVFAIFIPEMIDENLSTYLLDFEKYLVLRSFVF